MPMNAMTIPTHTTASTYEHVQRGWLIPLCLYGTAVFAALSLNTARKDEDLPWVIWGLPVLLLVLGHYFSALRVRVDAREVRVAWSWDWPAVRHALDSIEGAEACKHGWWYGYGLRWTSRGWLWNAQGAAAVRLRLRGGKCFHIGTDDQAGLLAAVNAALAARGAGAAPLKL